MVSLRAQKNWMENPPTAPYTIPRDVVKPKKSGGNRKLHHKPHKWAGSKRATTTSEGGHGVERESSFVASSSSPPTPGSSQQGQHKQQQETPSRAPTFAPPCCFDSWPEFYPATPQAPPAPPPSPPLFFPPTFFPFPPPFSPSYQPYHPPFPTPFYPEYHSSFQPVPYHNLPYMAPPGAPPGRNMPGPPPSSMNRQGNNYAFPWIPMRQNPSMAPAATPMMAPANAPDGKFQKPKQEEKEYKGPLIVSSDPPRRVPAAPTPAGRGQLFSSSTTTTAGSGSGSGSNSHSHSHSHNITPALGHAVARTAQPPPQGTQHGPIGSNKSVSFPNRQATNTNTNVSAISITRSVTIDVPFCNTAQYSTPPKGGVLKVINIPYNLTKREVMHFMGRDAKLLPHELGTPVHIIMERSTAKTMDCFVEFVTEADARNALEWVNRCLPSHTPRLGSRHVHVELSSQDELLKTIFPRAKCVAWVDGSPNIMPNTDRYSTGFQGFLTNEEMYCMVRHAENPRRAPFSEKCPQRTYEFMVSTLYKYPWHATKLYTVSERNMVFSACYRQLQALIFNSKNGRTLGLDIRLVQDLLNAGLRCPVFNERQKCLLLMVANIPKDYSNFSIFWPFDALGRKPDVPEDHVKEYAHVIRAAVSRKNPQTSELKNSWVSKDHGASPYGPILLEWRDECSKVDWQTAIDYETRLVNQLMADGLAALNVARTTPSLVNPAGPPRA